MSEIFHYEFMRNAFFAGVVVSVACGIVGTLVVVNRLSFLAGGVAHAAYGGLGLAAFLGWAPMAGTVPFALGSSLLMGYVARRNKERADTLIGVMWAAGMAVGIVLLDLKSGYYVDLMSYLFGSITTVSRLNLFLMLLLDGVIVTVVILFYKEISGMSYDEEFAQISGVPVRLLFYVQLTIIAGTVIMLIQAVGLILVMALFTIPASIAELYTKDLRRMMVIASILGALFATGGLLLSWYFDVTAGAMIVLVACAAYGISLVLNGRKKKRPVFPDSEDNSNRQRSDAVTRLQCETRNELCRNKR